VKNLFAQTAYLGYNDLPFSIINLRYKERIDDPQVHIARNGESVERPDPLSALAGY
jgi:hypothetical protein